MVASSAKMYTQPVIHAHLRPHSRRAHGYTPPATGNWATISLNTSATSIWPKPAINRLQIIGGPAAASANAKTV